MLKESHCGYGSVSHLTLPSMRDRLDWPYFQNGTVSCKCIHLPHGRLICIFLQQIKFPNLMHSINQESFSVNVKNEGKWWIFNFFPDNNQPSVTMSITHSYLSECVFPGVHFVVLFRYERVLGLRLIIFALTVNINEIFNAFSLIPCIFPMFWSPLQTVWKFKGLTEWHVHWACCIIWRHFLKQPC